MTDEHRRELARRLRSELPDVVSDADDRARVAAELDGALAEVDPDAVLDALTSIPETQAWFAAHEPVARDTERGVQGLPGDPAPGVYYICPEKDADKALAAVPDEPPRCPNHCIPMIAKV